MSDNENNSGGGIILKANTGTNFVTAFFKAKMSLLNCDLVFKLVYNSAAKRREKKLYHTSIDQSIDKN